MSACTAHVFLLDLTRGPAGRSPRKAWEPEPSVPLELAPAAIVFASLRACLFLRPPAIVLCCFPKHPDDFKTEKHDSVPVGAPLDGCQCREQDHTGICVLVYLQNPGLSGSAVGVSEALVLLPGETGACSSV